MNTPKLIRRWRYTPGVNPIIYPVQLHYIGVSWYKIDGEDIVYAPESGHFATYEEAYQALFNERVNDVIYQQQNLMRAQERLADVGNLPSTEPKDS